jgi:hypothetical protein
LKIIVSGMVAGNPGQGGAAWAVLQYLLGLLQLGHDAYLIEPISSEQVVPASSQLQPSANAAYFLSVVREFGLERRCSLLLQGTKQTVGLSYADLQTLTKDATLLLNISGMLQQQELVERIPHRAYLDLDPGFNQLWQATQGIDMRLAMHNVFVTVGKAIGQPMCPIPTCGLEWITTFQPVVFSYWPPADRITHDGLTTIANWRSYGSINHGGVFYGQKAHSLRALIDLPKSSSEKFLLALAIDPGEHRDVQSLVENGWILLDPGQLVGTPRQYQQFVSRSKAEFGIAKSGYVVSRCGWFSDRSACYLASGRPVLAQDTGFSAYLPCGEGLLNFSNRDDVLSAIESVNRDYGAHRRAARSIATEYFESNRVLTTLLKTMGLVE